MGDKLQDVPLQSYAGQYFGLACNALGDYRRASELLRVGHASRRKPEGWTGAPRHGRVLGRASGDQPCLVRALSRGAGRVRRGRRRRPPGGGPGRRTRAAPTASPAACIGLGYVCLVKGDLDAAGPVLERACSVAREANLTLLRPQATRLLGGAYLLAGRIEEGVALVRAAADEVESRRLLMQEAAVLGIARRGLPLRRSRRRGIDRRPAGAEPRQ